jgi:hypothetical protein
MREKSDARSIVKLDNTHPQGCANHGFTRQRPRTMKLLKDSANAPTNHLK